MMVRGSTSPGSNIDVETIMIKVAQTQQYGNELEKAVAFIMNNGHSESDIRFTYPDTSDTPTRQIFHRNGGGAIYRAPPVGVQTTVTPWVFTARNAVQRVGTSEATDASVDLIAVLPNVTQSFCIALNNAVNVTNPSGIPPRDDSTAAVTSAYAFFGIFQAGRWIGDTGQYLYGKKEGCFEGGSDPAIGTYHYYRVLLVR